MKRSEVAGLSGEPMARSSQSASPSTWMLLTPLLLTPLPLLTLLLLLLTPPLGLLTLSDVVAEEERRMIFGAGVNVTRLKRLRMGPRTRGLLHERAAAPNTRRCIVTATSRACVRACARREHRQSFIMFVRLQSRKQ